MIDVIWLLRTLVTAYIWIIILQAVLSWLIGFGTINAKNPQVRMLWKALTVVTEPVLAPIRRLLPTAGGLDFAPLVVILACQVLLGFLK